MQWFWQGHYQSGIPFYTLSCFQTALAIVPLCFGLCLLVSFWLADINAIIDCTLWLISIQHPFVALPLSYFSKMFFIAETSRAKVANHMVFAAAG